MAVSTFSRLFILFLIFSSHCVILQGRALLEEQEDIRNQRVLKEFRFDTFRIIKRRSLINSERIVPGGPDPKHHY